MRGAIGANRKPAKRSRSLKATSKKKGPKYPKQRNASGKVGARRKQSVNTNNDNALAMEDTVFSQSSQSSQMDSRSQASEIKQSMRHLQSHESSLTTSCSHQIIEKDPNNPLLTTIYETKEQSRSTTREEFSREMNQRLCMKKINDTMHSANVEINTRRARLISDFEKGGTPMTEEELCALEDKADRVRVPLLLHPVVKANQTTFPFVSAVGIRPHRILTLQGEKPSQLKSLVNPDLFAFTIDTLRGHWPLCTDMIFQLVQSHADMRLPFLFHDSEAVQVIRTLPILEGEMLLRSMAASGLLGLCVQGQAWLDIPACSTWLKSGYLNDWNSPTLVAVRALHWAQSGSRKYCKPPPHSPILSVRVLAKSTRLDVGKGSGCGSFVRNIPGADALRIVRPLPPFVTVPALGIHVDPRLCAPLSHDFPTDSPYLFATCCPFPDLLGSSTRCTLSAAMRLSDGSLEMEAMGLELVLHREMLRLGRLLQPTWNVRKACMPRPPDARATSTFHSSLPVPLTLHRENAPAFVTVGQDRVDIDVVPRLLHNMGNSNDRDQVINTLLESQSGDEWKMPALRASLARFHSGDIRTFDDQKRCREATIDNYNRYMAEKRNTKPPAPIVDGCGLSREGMDSDQPFLSARAVSRAMQNHNLTPRFVKGCMGTGF
jgi:hypothetical protein